MNAFFASHLSTLEATERAAPEALARYQAGLLEQIARHAFDRAPFYRDRLSCLFKADGTFDLAGWYDVPIFSRAEAAAHAEAMHVADLPVDRYGSVGEFSTSGSTAEPLKVLTNGLVSLSSNASLARMARWFDMDASRPLAIIRGFADDLAAAYPDGATARNWIFSHPSQQFSLSMNARPDQQAEWLKRMNAPYLLTHPTNAVALAEAVSAEEGRALGLEMVIAFGETVPDGTPALVRERLGANFASYYACTEVGMIATECPCPTHHHIAIENVLFEVIDDRGAPVPPGERGRVIVTGLYNYAMPFIRYDLGDVAVADAGMCPCGRTLPLIARIEGRTRHAFTFEDGTRTWPRGALVRPMAEFVPFRRYQMVQLDRRRIELRYIPDGSGREPDLEGLTAYARRKLHPTVEITARQMEALPLGPSGKFEDIFSMVAPAAPSSPS